MYKKILSVLLFVMFISTGSSVFAQEMERWTSFTTTDTSFQSMRLNMLSLQKPYNIFDYKMLKPLSPNFRADKDFQGLKYKVPQLAHMISVLDQHHQSIPTFPKAEPVIHSQMNNHLFNNHMEPFFTKAGRWEDRISQYMHQDIQKSFKNSVPDPSHIYAVNKLKHDLLKGFNTAVSIGSAASGNPFAVASATNNIIRNYGPQSGKIHDITGHLGNALFIANSGSNIASGSYSNAAVGIMNHALGGTITAQNNRLMEPVTTSDVKHYRFKTQDGFTRTEGMGSIHVTKTYTPPNTNSIFGVPDIFDGSTRITTKTHAVTKVQTGHFNNQLQAFINNMPQMLKYQAPKLNSYNSFKNYSLPVYKPVYKTNYTTPRFKYTYQTPKLNNYNSFKTYSYNRYSVPTYRPTYYRPSFSYNYNFRR